MKTKRRVGFIGLGKLGAPCAQLMAQHHEVVGYDIVQRDVPGVTTVSTIAKAVEESQLIFVAVPTPHAPEYDGSTPTSALAPRDFDYTTLKAVLAEVSTHVTAKQRLVVISTVLPGTCRRELAPYLSATGATLIYNPYFVAMGSVQSDFLDPEFIVMGTDSGSVNSSDSSAISDLTDFYRALIGEHRFLHLTWEEAESVKVFYNTFISLKISFVNMIQDVAINLGHTDVDRVTSALVSAGRRVTSGMYMRAGMGDGGPCHPRDNIALRHLAEQLGIGYDLFSAVLSCREGQAENMARYLAGYLLPIVIVGKSYKPGVPYVDGSYSVLVAHYLKQSGQIVGFIDSLTGDNAADVLGPCTYLLAHEWSSIESVSFHPGSVVVDPWRSCPSIPGSRVVHYGNTRI